MLTVSKLIPYTWVTVKNNNIILVQMKHYMCRVWCTCCAHHTHLAFHTRRHHVAHMVRVVRTAHANNAVYVTSIVHTMCTEQAW